MSHPFDGAPLPGRCDERDRENCRNGHGCHCREITALVADRDEARADVARIKVQRDNALIDTPGGTA